MYKSKPGNGVPAWTAEYLVVQQNKPTAVFPMPFAPQSIVTPLRTALSLDR